MTDKDRFEQELASLQPRRPSEELKRRVAEELATTPTKNGRPPRYWWATRTKSILKTPLPVLHRLPARNYAAALLGGALAAGLAAVILWRGNGESVELQPVAALEANVTTAFDKSLPSIWSFRCALSGPRTSLDEVLDKYGARTLEHKAGGAPDLLAARFHSDLDSFFGEL
jgi:hypothetical protein